MQLRPSDSSIKKLRLIASSWLAIAGAGTGFACDLCAIYRAGSAKGESHQGFLVSIAQQFTSAHTTQFESREVAPPNREYVETAITHLVAGYNPSSRFGISLNLPITHIQYRRSDLQYSLTAPPALMHEQGVESGLGDLSLVARYTVFEHRTMSYGVIVNALIGVKTPTGDSDRIESELAQTRIYNQLIPAGVPHDPLGHSITSVHQHALATGTGSIDAIAGLTTSLNWERWFLNSQFQYYARTEGVDGFRMGDLLMVSGGPGAFLLVSPRRTLSLQLNGSYECMQRDEILGQPSDRTGSRAWFIGPLATFTWRNQFSFNAGVDMPLQVANNGYQIIPDFRIHGGVSFSF